MFCSLCVRHRCSRGAPTAAITGAQRAVEVRAALCNPVGALAILEVRTQPAEALPTSVSTQPASSRFCSSGLSCCGVLPFLSRWAQLRPRANPTRGKVRSMKAESKTWPAPALFQWVMLLGGVAVGSGCSGGLPPEGPSCGGIAGIPCPGAGQCEDDPSDNCDPDQGGADCGGICTCNVEGDCTSGFVWDSSPEVCGCVASPTTCADITCEAGTHCVDLPDGTARCVSRDPCHGYECPEGTRCIAPADAPYCVPNEGEACGSNVCDQGMVCCNPSCGICTPPDGACTQQVCPPEE